MASVKFTGLGQGGSGLCSCRFHHWLSDAGPVPLLYPGFLSLIRANNTDLLYKELSSPQKSGCYYDDWQSHHGSGINFFQIQMLKIF